MGFFFSFFKRQGLTLQPSLASNLQQSSFLRSFRRAGITDVNHIWPAKGISDEGTRNDTGALKTSQRMTRGPVYAYVKLHPEQRVGGVGMMHLQ